MFTYKNKQKIYNIGGVNIGGNPGELPTVLIGSIFFSGHRIISDPVKGIFDKERAKALLNREEEVSAETGNPRFIDVIGDTSESLIKYIEFVAHCTRSPILVDSPSQRVRIEVIRHFANSELIPRLIYNSIAEDYTEEELACVKECKLENAIILAISTRAIKPAARLKLLSERLMPAAELAGITNAIVDTGVMDVPSVSLASIAINDVREAFGCPAGCAPANAIYNWEKSKNKGAPIFQATTSAVLSFTQLLGANFLFYGSVNNAPWIYPAVATTDALISYGVRLNKVRPLTQDHPLYKIF